MAQKLLKPFILDETGKEIVVAPNTVAEQLAAINETLKDKNGGDATV